MMKMFGIYGFDIYVMMMIFVGSGGVKGGLMFDMLMKMSLIGKCIGVCMGKENN